MSTEIGSGLPPDRGLLTEMADNARSPEWVIDGILPAASLIIFAGLPKVSKKSLTTMHMALQVAQGLPYLGRNTNTRAVVYSALEDGYNRIGDRARRFGISKATHPMLRVFGTASEQAFWEYQQRLNDCTDPVLWIVDPLVELETLYNIEDENSAPAIAKMLKPFRALAQRKGHTIVFIHHKRKEGDQMRGSGALNGATDGWWDLTPGRGDLVTIETRLRDASSERFGVEIREDNRGQFVVTGKPPEEKSETTGRYQRKQKVEVEDDAQVKINKSARKIRDTLRSKPDQFWNIAALALELELDRNTVSRALTALQDVGEVDPPAGQPGEGGHGYVWHQRREKKDDTIEEMNDTDDSKNNTVSNVLQFHAAKPNGDDNGF